MAREAQANSLLSPITAAADRLESTTMFKLVAKVTVGPGPVIKFGNFNWQLQVSSSWLFHRDTDSDSEQTGT